MRTAAGPFAQRLHSVKELLGGGTGILTRVTDRAAGANRWRAWLSQHLPPELRAKVSGVTEREGTLVIFAESAAWSARLRYAALELESAIRAEDPGITAVAVRVLPRG
jgi:hypothetical protein